MDTNSQVFFFFFVFPLLPCLSHSQILSNTHMHSCTHITATRPHHSPIATACTAVAMETPVSLVILWIGCNEQGCRGENSLTWWQVKTVKLKHVTQKDTWIRFAHILQTLGLVLMSVGCIIPPIDKVFHSATLCYKSSLIGMLQLTS